MPLLGYAWQLLTYLPRQQTRESLIECKRIVEKFQPDLIHVHGTEGFYGLLGGQVEKALVISLQGILSEYAKVYWGSIPWWRRPLFPREMLLHSRMRQNASRETGIIRQNRYFTGRTHWDQATLLRINPDAEYFSDGARLLRPDFYGPKWSLESSVRCRLYTTVTARPYKGTDTLIESLDLIRRKYPAASLKIGGYLPNSGYGAYLRRLIRKLGLSDHVELLGFVEAQDIISELQAAHVYVLGSHIENSPNSVAEAQALGTPCVATSAGGTPSMVRDESSGVLYPAGNPIALAECLDRIFSDDRFARTLSKGERLQAEWRGDKNTNIGRLIEIYNEILSRHQSRNYG
jgi:glycosyltransferase involved in cell wall biosynthesis